PADVAKAMGAWSAPLPKGPSAAKTADAAAPSTAASLQPTAKIGGTLQPTVAEPDQPGARKARPLIVGVVLVAAVRRALLWFSPHWLEGVLGKRQPEATKKDAGATDIAKVNPKVEGPSAKPPDGKASPGQTHFERGQAHLKKLELAQAIAEFTKAIELD